MRRKPDTRTYYARPAATLQSWDHWYCLHWIILRAVHIVDLEWSGSVVRPCWFRRARPKVEED